MRHARQVSDQNELIATYLTAQLCHVNLLKPFYARHDDWACKGSESAVCPALAVSFCP